MTAEEQAKKIDQVNWIFASFRETLEKMRDEQEEVAVDDFKRLED